MNLKDIFTLDKAGKEAFYAYVFSICFAAVLLTIGIFSSSAFAESVDSVVQMFTRIMQ